VRDWAIDIPDRIPRQRSGELEDNAVESPMARGANVDKMGGAAVGGEDRPQTGTRKPWVAAASGQSDWHAGDNTFHP
jgi:hypothetical protein